jgi:hypothetical protein
VKFDDLCRRPLTLPSSNIQQNIELSALSVKSGSVSNMGKFFLTCGNLKTRSLLVDSFFVRLFGAVFVLCLGV